MFNKGVALMVTTAALAFSACGPNVIVEPKSETPKDNNPDGKTAENCASPEIITISQDTNRPDYYNPRSPLCLISGSGAALEKAHAAYQPENQDKQDSANPTPTYETRHATGEFGIEVNSQFLKNYPLGVYIDRVALDKLYPFLKEILRKYGIDDKHTYMVVLQGTENPYSVNEGQNVTLVMNPLLTSRRGNNEMNARGIDPISDAVTANGLHSTRLFQEFVFSFLNVNVKSPAMMRALMIEIFSNADGMNPFVLELPSSHSLGTNYLLKLYNLLECGKVTCGMPSNPPLLKGVSLAPIIDLPNKPQQSSRDVRFDTFTDRYVKRADRQF